MLVKQRIFELRRVSAAISVRGDRAPDVAWTIRPGKSARRATPMPCGSRPSIAALTRSGARNASEIVMLTLRALHPLRSAILSAVAVASLVSSSSQRRPARPEPTRGRLYN